MLKGTVTAALQATVPVKYWQVVVDFCSVKFCILVGITQKSYSKFFEAAFYKDSLFIM